MKVVIISDKYRSGGAAIAAYRIAEGYKLMGAHVVHIVGFNDRLERTVIDIGKIRFGRKRYRADININSKGPLLKEIIQKFYSIRILDETKKQRPDIIHLHNIHGLLPNPSLITNLDRLGIPVVWTLHDMWAFTGHCAYSLDCEKYKDNACDRLCPRPNEFPPLKKKYIKKEFEKRKRIYAKAMNLHIVTPSKWLAEAAKQSIGGSIGISVIANGIDYEYYRPIEKKSAKKALGLSPDKQYVLSVCQSLREVRKGWHYLEKALGLIDSAKFELLACGAGPLADDNSFGMPVHNIGFIENEPMLRIVYSAADLFVIPSIAENLPNVIIESISCGTPCLGFNVGGIPEIIRDGVTGYIAESKNIYDLAAKILYVIDMDKDEYEQLSKSCRSVVKSEYGYKAQALRYLELFETLKHRAVNCRKSG